MQGDSFHFSFRHRTRGRCWRQRRGQRALVGLRLAKRVHPRPRWPSHRRAGGSGRLVRRPRRPSRRTGDERGARRPGARVSSHGRPVVANEWPKELPLRDLGEHRLKDLARAPAPVPARRLRARAGVPASEDAREPAEGPTCQYNRRRSLGASMSSRELLKLVGDERVRLVHLYWPRRLRQDAPCAPGGSGADRALPERRLPRPPGVRSPSPKLFLPTIAQTLGVRGAIRRVDRRDPRSRSGTRRSCCSCSTTSSRCSTRPRAVGRAPRAPRPEPEPTRHQPLVAPSRRPSTSTRSTTRPGTKRVALFAERARAAKASFSLNGNRPVVAEICRRLDGVAGSDGARGPRVKLLPRSRYGAVRRQAERLTSGGP